MKRRHEKKASDMNGFMILELQIIIKEKAANYFVKLARRKQEVIFRA
jgi:hypothetical protein